MADDPKIGKMRFRPRPKAQKSEKQRFGHGRRPKNWKNEVSAAAETSKSILFSIDEPQKVTRKSRRFQIR